MIPGARAVVVGLGALPGDSLERLPGARRAALEFADWLLENGLPPQFLTLLTSGPGADGRSEIERDFTLPGLKRSLQPVACSKLILFWSGHGYRKFGAEDEHLLLVPGDSDALTEISLSNLRQHLNTIEDSEAFVSQVFVIDSCAPVLTPEQVGGSPARYTFSTGLSVPDTREQYVLFAARKRQSSFGTPGESSGISRFSRAFLSQLQGLDQLISNPPRDLHEAVHQELVKLCEKDSIPSQSTYYEAFASGPDYKYPITPTIIGPAKGRNYPPLLAYRPNRRPQYDQILDMVHEQLGRADHAIPESHSATPSSPNNNIKTFIVHGEEHECHQHFMEIALDSELPRLFGLGDNSNIKNILLHWPVGTTKYPEVKTRAFQDLHRSTTVQSAPDPRNVAAAISSHPGPIVVRSFLFTDDFRHDSSAIFRHFARFWDEWPASPSHPFLVFLCIAYLGDHRSTLLRYLRFSTRDRINNKLKSFIEDLIHRSPSDLNAIVLELREVPVADVFRWAVSDEVARVRHSADIVDQVSAIFARDSRESFPMRFLAKKLEMILANTREQ